MKLYSKTRLIIVGQSSAPLGGEKGNKKLVKKFSYSKGVRMVFLVIMLVGGILGAILASNKNRSPFAWFAICFLLPIAVFIILALSKIEKEPAKVEVPLSTPSTPLNTENQVGDIEASHQVVSPDEIQCPMCAETIKKAAKICRYCKHDLSK